MRSLFRSLAIILLGSFLLCGLGAWASLPQGLITNKNFALSGYTSQQTITLNAPSSTIQIYSSPGASNIYFDFNNVAAAVSAGNTGVVFGGGSETFINLQPPVKAFKVISDGSTGTGVVVANFLDLDALLSALE